MEMKLEYVCNKFIDKHKNRMKMKKTSNKKQDSGRKHKSQAEKKFIEELPDLFIPLRFGQIQEYPVVVNQRLYKIRNTRGKKFL